MVNSTVTIKWHDEKFSIEGNNANTFELLGMLRYAEKEVWARLYSNNEANFKKRVAIRDFLEKNNCSMRLAGALLQYRELHKSEYVDQIEKGRFLKIRNAGINTWKEFSILKEKTK